MLRFDRRTLLWCVALTGAEKGLRWAWDALQPPNGTPNGPPWHPDEPYNRENARHAEILHQATLGPTTAPFPKEQFESLSRWTRNFQKKDIAGNCMVFFGHPAELRLWLLAAVRMYTSPICNVNKDRSHYNILRYDLMHDWVPSVTLLHRTEPNAIVPGIRPYPAADLYRFIERSLAGDPAINGPIAIPPNWDGPFPFDMPPPDHPFQARR